MHDYRGAFGDLSILEFPEALFLSTAYAEMPPVSPPVYSCKMGRLKAAFCRSTKKPAAIGELLCTN